MWLLPYGYCLICGAQLEGAQTSNEYCTPRAWTLPDAGPQRTGLVAPKSLSVKCLDRSSRSCSCLRAVRIECTLGESNSQPFSETPRGRRTCPLPRPLPMASQHALARSPAGRVPTLEPLEKDSWLRDSPGSWPRYGHAAGSSPRCSPGAPPHAPPWVPPGRGAPQEFPRRNSSFRNGVISRPLGGHRTRSRPLPSPRALPYAPPRLSVGRAASEEFFGKNSCAREGPVSRPDRRFPIRSKLVPHRPG